MESFVVKSITKSDIIQALNNRLKETGFLPTIKTLSDKICQDYAKAYAELLNGQVTEKGFKEYIDYQLTSNDIKRINKATLADTIKKSIKEKRSVALAYIENEKLIASAAIAINENTGFMLATILDDINAS